jgi:hypothetical protein
MPNIFEVDDPRGRSVICTEACWKWHILDYHHDMAGREAEVIAAITRPSLGIFSDTDFENRNVYYLRRSGKPYYLKVVVEFKSEREGEVITAYLAFSPKAGEKLIWPSSSS